MVNYFAAANSADGFVSWFDEVFARSDFSRVYIVKGGCGTGKSTLMRRAAELCVSRGGSAEGILCSSDPASLDGVIMTAADGRRIGMVDGTAPHVCEPRYPGAVDEIVNLGEYWCADLLSADRETVVSLTARKAEGYKSAYRDLKTAGTLMRALYSEAGGLLLRDKMDGAVRRLLKTRMKEKGVRGGGFRRTVRCLTALSCSGEVRLTSFDGFERVYAVNDHGCTAHFWMDAVCRAASELSLAVTVSPSALMPEMCDAVALPELGLAFVMLTERRDADVINMRRFVDAERYAASDRSRRRAAIRAAEGFKSAALDRLAEVRRLHASLEAVYIRAMDFTRLNDAAERLYSRMF